LSIRFYFSDSNFRTKSSNKQLVATNHQQKRCSRPILMRTDETSHTCTLEAILSGLKLVATTNH
jgi:hypothetical protein